MLCADEQHPVPVFLFHHSVFAAIVRSRYFIICATWSVVLDVEGEALGHLVHGSGVLHRPELCVGVGTAPPGRAFSSRPSTFPVRSARILALGQ